RRSTIANAKNQLSRLLAAVRAGESVLILDRDRPIARLEPVREGEAGVLSEPLARLEHAGLLRRAREPVPASLLAEPRTVRRQRGRAPGTDSGLLEALLEDRRAGR